MKGIRMQANFTIFFIGLLFAVSGAILFYQKAFEAVYNWIFFSKSSPIVLMGGSGIWFLYNVATLSEADFGNYSKVLFVFFFVLIFLSFFRMHEFLAVRGLAILLLLMSNIALNNVRFDPIAGKAFFASAIYAVILLSMLFGSLPYLFKYVLDRLSGNVSLKFVTGSILILYGALLIWIAC